MFDRLKEKKSAPLLMQYLKWGALGFPIFFVGLQTFSLRAEDEPTIPSAKPVAKGSFSVGEVAPPVAGGGAGASKTSAKPAQRPAVGEATTQPAVPQSTGLGKELMAEMEPPAPVLKVVPKPKVEDSLAEGEKYVPGPQGMVRVVDRERVIVWPKAESFFRANEKESSKKKDLGAPVETVEALRDNQKYPLRRAFDRQMRSELKAVAHRQSIELKDLYASHRSRRREFDRRVGRSNRQITPEERLEFVRSLDKEMSGLRTRHLREKKALKLEQARKKKKFTQYLAKSQRPPQVLWEATVANVRDLEPEKKRADQIGSATLPDQKGAVAAAPGKAPTKPMTKPTTKAVARSKFAEPPGGVTGVKRTLKKRVKRPAKKQPESPAGQAPEKNETQKN